MRSLRGGFLLTLIATKRNLYFFNSNEFFQATSLNIIFYNSSEEFMTRIFTASPPPFPLSDILVPPL